jgi:hypothetical protein
MWAILTNDFAAPGNMTVFYISAINGHTECLRLLMETSDDNNIVDINDARDRYSIYSLFSFTV